MQRLKWGIAHDPCKAGDRTPLGAVTLGQSVSVLLRVSDDARHLVAGVDLVVSMDGSAKRLPMSPTQRGFECSVEMGHEPQVAYYHFELSLFDDDSCMYVPREDGRSTAGMLKPLDDRSLNGFQISVYEPAFATPTWLAGTIMYQVFPDRFARGAHGVRLDGMACHKAMGRPVHLRGSWDEPIVWEEDGPYDPVDFYGGTLEGIRGKLPYLASLGVEVLYLNPVFEARSYHRYDTADYEHVDPLLGSDEELSLLCKEAADLGIAVILDAVLSHTGSDSRYFNANGSYELPGAAQGVESPYYRWFEFFEEEEGVPYRCWWGDPSLPEVDERDEGWQRYIFGDVLPKWIEAGARGYRLDVADEIPDDVLEKLRSAVKAANPQAAIIGEVWEDATTKESYGRMRTYALGRALDSVMNYPLRGALISFALGKWDAHQLATFLKLQHANYPKPLYMCLMNLLSSHDVERIRTVLALEKPIRHDCRIDQFQAVEGITVEQDEHAAKLQLMLAGIIYALPGMPCIYYGDERGMLGGADPFCRAPMVWGRPRGRSDYGQDVTEAYKALGAMRKGSRTLRQGGFGCVAIGKDVIAIVRSLEHERACTLCIVNRSDTPKKVVLDAKLPEFAMLAGCAGATIPEFESCEDGLAIITAPSCAALFVELTGCQKAS